MEPSRPSFAARRPPTHTHSRAEGDRARTSPRESALRSSLVLGRRSRTHRLLSARRKPGARDETGVGDIIRSSRARAGLTERATAPPGSAVAMESAMHPSKSCQDLIQAERPGFPAGLRVRAGIDASAVRVRPGRFRSPGSSSSRPHPAPHIERGRCFLVPLPPVRHALAHGRDPSIVLAGARRHEGQRALDAGEEAAGGHRVQRCVDGPARDATRPGFFRVHVSRGRVGASLAFFVSLGAPPAGASARRANRPARAPGPRPPPPRPRPRARDPAASHRACATVPARERARALAPPPGPGG